MRKDGGGVALNGIALMCVAIVCSLRQRRLTGWGVKMKVSNQLVSLILGVVSCFTAQTFAGEYGPKLDSKIFGSLKN